MTDGDDLQDGLQDAPLQDAPLQDGLQNALQDGLQDGLQDDGDFSDRRERACEVRTDDVMVLCTSSLDCGVKMQDCGDSEDDGGEGIDGEGGGDGGGGGRDGGGLVCTVDMQCQMQAGCLETQLRCGPRADQRMDQRPDKDGVSMAVPCILYDDVS